MGFPDFLVNALEKEFQPCSLGLNWVDLEGYWAYKKGDLVNKE
jgi:hypothetical protein